MNLHVGVLLIVSHHRSVSSFDFISLGAVVDVELVVSGLQLASRTVLVLAVDSVHLPGPSLNGRETFSRFHLFSSLVPID